MPKAEPELEKAEVKPEQETVSRDNPPRDLLAGQYRGLEIFSKSGDPNDPIPGYRTFWAVDRDQGSRIGLLKRSGWEHVRCDEVLMNEGQGSDDAAGNVRKWSKETGPNGNPYYMYLLKKPLWLQKIHDADPNSSDSINNRVEAQIKGGNVSSKPEDKQYAAGQVPGSTMPPIDISSKLYR